MTHLTEIPIVQGVGIFKGKLLSGVKGCKFVSSLSFWDQNLKSVTPCDVTDGLFDNLSSNRQITITPHTLPRAH